MNLLLRGNQVANLIVPRMVFRSPGMEQVGLKQPHDVLPIGKGDSTPVFNHHRA
jgi:hypothetical protein